MTTGLWAPSLLGKLQSSCTGCKTQLVYIARAEKGRGSGPIPFFTSENTFAVPIPVPEAVAVFVPGSLNGRFGRDGDGETPTLPEQGL